MQISMVVDAGSSEAGSRNIHWSGEQEYPVNIPWSGLWCCYGNSSSYMYPNRKHTLVKSNKSL